MRPWSQLKSWGHWLGGWSIRSAVPELLLIATLAMARYLQNSDFSYPSEIIINIILLGICALFYYHVMRLVLRSRRAAHIAALLLSYASYSFTTSFPTLHRWVNAPIPNSLTPFGQDILVIVGLAIVFGAFGVVVDQLFKRITQLRSVPLLRFIIFVVAFIFVAELGKVGLRIWTIRHDLAYRQPAASLPQDKSAIKSKPNVYYLLFDRYGNDTTLRNIYDYDNSGLLDYLDGQGFVTRHDAYANYPFTTQSVSSTLSMDYHGDLAAQFQNDSVGFQTAFPYRQQLDNPVVAQALKSNGYHYNQVSSWWDFTRKIPAADSEPTESFRLRILGKNFWLSDLQRDIVNRSILSPLLLKGITIGHTTLIQYQLDRNPTQNFYAEMHALKRIAADSASQRQPQFTFAHILSPHDPYIFDAEGNKPTYDSNRTDNGVDERIKYTNQVTYLNTQIKQLVGTIRHDDPNAVIVLQADEGPYPKQFRGKLTGSHYYDPKDLPLAQMRQKFGVLASYYMPGIDQQTVSTQLNASVNAFRFVLDNYLGYKLPLLPDCQFTAGDKFNLYTYQLVSGKLKGTAEPADCKQYR